MMKIFLVMVLANLAALNLYAAGPVNFNFDKLRNCRGSFDYEKVFLMDGRAPSEVLRRDPAATRLISQINFGGPLRLVTEAYSMEMSPSYINYEHLKHSVKRLAIALVEKQRSGPAPGDQGGYDYDLVLVVPQGEGAVLASHPARINARTGALESPRFHCTR